jgi:hypothetical protein
MALNLRPKKGLAANMVSSGLFPILFVVLNIGISFPRVPRARILHHVGERGSPTRWSPLNGKLPDYSEI